MARRQADERTLDLLNWQPPQIVRRYEEQKVRAASLRARIAHGVSATMKECGLSREEIAARMGAWLGEEISVHMLNAYASEAREAHSIPHLRLLALIHVTGDVRLLGLGAELFGHSIVEDRWLPWVEVGQRADNKEQTANLAEQSERDFQLALRTARQGVRS